MAVFAAAAAAANDHGTPPPPPGFSILDGGFKQQQQQQQRPGRLSNATAVSAFLHPRARCHTISEGLVLNSGKNSGGGGGGIHGFVGERVEHAATRNNNSNHSRNFHDR